MKIKKNSYVFMCLMLISMMAGCENQGLSNDEQNTTTEKTDTSADSKEMEEINQILKNSTFYFPEKDDDALALYYTMADERRESILHSPTEIVKSNELIRGETYTGNAYYVSPNGNDENNGLSPESAWKTAGRTCWGDVQPGDAVFFERGGVYRMTDISLQILTDVTYSAYGEGAKPVITGVKENSARPECWKLWYENETGTKIWKYYEQLGDVGGIIFDDKEYADRVLEWPTPEGWLALDIVTYDAAHGDFKEGNPCALWDPVSAEEYRRVEDNLKENMTYISRVSLENFSYPFELVNYERVGDLYLRCDEGNPGDIFSDIEIISVTMGQYEPYTWLINGNAKGFVLDNISVKYYQDNAIEANIINSSDIIIQNCTIEWGGNRLFQIQSAEPTSEFSLIGDSIYGIVNNVTIRNNYFRQGGNSFTFESNDILSQSDQTFGTYLAEGNLIENCGQGIRTYFIEEEDINRLDALILRDNIIIDTGISMNNACWEMPAAIDLGDNAVQFAKTIEVTDNIAIGCESALLRIPDTEVVQMNIHDNVFAQYRDRALICEGGPWIEGNTTWHMMEDAK